MGGGEVLGLGEFEGDSEGSFLAFAGEIGGGFVVELEAQFIAVRAEEGGAEGAFTFAHALEFGGKIFFDAGLVFDKQFFELRNAPLLVLDDLAMQSATPWAREKMMQLIDHRYVARLPTVVTTAADKSELGARLESRLLDPQLSIICPITAPMYRGRKRKSGGSAQ